jgi:hypothetical protein
LINRRERSTFTPSNVTEVRRRFDRILKQCEENAADAALKQHSAPLKPIVPAASAIRRVPRVMRPKG